jgi:hypothetical protein
MQNNTFNEYFAKGQFYEMVNGTKTLCDVKQFAVTVAASQTDASLVAVVANKRIRLLSLAVKCHTADCDYALTSKPSASPGAVIFTAWAMFKQLNFYPYQQIGIVETGIDNGLAVSTGSGGELRFSGRYIEFTP